MAAGQNWDICEEKETLGLQPRPRDENLLWILRWGGGQYFPEVQECWEAAAVLNICLHVFSHLSYKVIFFISNHWLDWWWSSWRFPAGTVGWRHRLQCALNIDTGTRRPRWNRRKQWTTGTFSFLLMSEERLVKTNQEFVYLTSQPKILQDCVYIQLRSSTTRNHKHISIQTTHNKSQVSEPEMKLWTWCDSTDEIIKEPTVYNLQATSDASWATWRDQLFKPPDGWFQKQPAQQWAAPGQTATSNQFTNISKCSKHQTPSFILTTFIGSIWWFSYATELQVWFLSPWEFNKLKN